jgi:hypothetical protein
VNFDSAAKSGGIYQGENMQNLQCASENIEFSMPSTPAPAAEPVAIAEEAIGEDLWADWPYCWAIDLHEIARRRFHSFHQNLFEWRLARDNRRAQARFWAQHWWTWQRHEEDEVLELRLV